MLDAPNSNEQEEDMNFGQPTQQAKWTKLFLHGPRRRKCDVSLKIPLDHPLCAKKANQRAEWFGSIYCRASDHCVRRKKTNQVLGSVPCKKLVGRRVIGPHARERRSTTIAPTW
jgi:hypothetical protein